MHVSVIIKQYLLFDLNERNVDLLNKTARAGKKLYDLPVFCFIS